MSFRRVTWTKVAETVRARRRAGWFLWETTNGPMWARWRTDAHASIETEPVAPDELEVVDDVIREEGDEADSDS